MRPDPANTTRGTLQAPQTRPVCVTRGFSRGLAFALPWALVLWGLIINAALLIL